MMMVGTSVKTTFTLNESRNEIRLGMRFESKSQLKKAITLRSVSQNREFRVVESRINTWAAK